MQELEALRTQLQQSREAQQESQVKVLQAERAAESLQAELAQAHDHVRQLRSECERYKALVESLDERLAELEAQPAGAPMDSMRQSVANEMEEATIELYVPSLRFQLTWYRKTRLQNAQRQRIHAADELAKTQADLETAHQKRNELV